MTTNLHISVLGRPSPQGSKKHVGGGRMAEASKYLPAWRKAVCTAAVKAVQDELWAKPAGPVEIAVTFYLERPTTIKPDKRPMPIKPPDLDKLVRGVCDALSDAGVWEDGCTGGEADRVQRVCRHTGTGLRHRGHHL